MARPIQLFLASMLLMVSFPVSAQNRVSAMSLFLKAGQAIPNECQQEATVFKQIASAFPHPKSGWSFVVICDENSWKAALQRMGVDDPDREHFGETDIDHNITYFRGWPLVNYRLGNPTPEHIVAHGLAHIMLHSRDEELVDRTALDWIKRRGTYQIANAR